MVKMSKDTKRRVTNVISLAKTVFHWGFIPTVLYLGEFSLVYLIIARECFGKMTKTQNC
jgi:TOM7 family